MDDSRDPLSVLWGTRGPSDFAAGQGDAHDSATIPMKDAPTPRDITGADIKAYLDSRDDFDLELFAYRSLQERGWGAHLGGSYSDPVEGKLRQYDVRGQFVFANQCDLSMAVECKSLTPEFPLVVSRIPRPDVDAQHDVVARWRRRGIEDTVFQVWHSDPTRLQLYGAGPQNMVGKSATQIRWENGKRLVASDAQTYDKWTQAAASAAGLVTMAASQKVQAGEAPTLTFVMPVLLVNDGTLWVVDYTEDGQRSEPAPADEALLYVDRYVVLPGRYGEDRYHLGHLHIYTRSSFTRMLENFRSPTGLMLERTFGFALRKLATEGALA